MSFHIVHTDVVSHYWPLEECGLHMFKVGQCGVYYHYFIQSVYLSVCV